MNAMNNELKGLYGAVQEAVQCGCIGPQNGEPVCPCQMRSVIIENGRYVLRRDLGPAASRAPARLPTPAEEAAERLGVEPFGYAERS